MPWVNDPYEWFDPEVGRKADMWVNDPHKTTPDPPPTKLGPKYPESHAALHSHLTTALGRIRAPRIKALQAEMIRRWGARGIGSIPPAHINEAIELFRTFE